MSERSQYVTLRDHLCQPGDRMDRVENLVLVGMPDINLCAEGIEAWIEMKNPTEPKRDRTPLFGSNHRLSIDQENWFIRQDQAGGRGFVLIATDKRWILMSGHDATMINTASVGLLLSRSVWNHSKPIRGSAAWAQLRQRILHSRRHPLITNAAA